jgi:cardiolipin synthase
MSGVRALGRRLGRAVTPSCGWREQLRRLRQRLIWAAVVLTVISVPLIAFALVGLPHVFRSPAVRSVLADGSITGAPAVSDARFGATMALLTGTRLTTGNHVEILTDGNGTFPRLWADLRSARRSITVQMYYAGPGAVADSATRILADRARTGVDVYFLYDSFGAQDFPHRYLDTLRAAGARTAELRPIRWYALDRANHRSHVRGIVVDGAVGYTGGFGLDDKWLGGGRRPGEWRETNVRFTGPAVRQLQAVFVAKWAEAKGELLTDPVLDPDSVEFAGMPERRMPGDTAALLHSPPLTGSTTAERLLALSIAGARRTLYVSNAYFVPHPDFVRQLAGAARRGVDVRILTNGAQTDVGPTWLAGRSLYEPLLSAGVRIYEYQPTTIHAKTFVVDGVWSAVATMNFDNRSLAYNDEVALVTRDAGTGATLDSLFLDDLRFAQEIRLDEFRRRPWTTRLLERAAGLVAGLL